MCAPDPGVCNTLFATFICTEITDTQSVLVADDRVMCEDDNHHALQVVSFFLIALIGCGVPIGAAEFLRRAHAAREPVEVAMQHRLASDYGLSPPAASDLINDIKFGSSYGFLVSAYRSSMYMWESVDSELLLLALACVEMSALFLLICGRVTHVSCVHSGT